ncbi:hypothetical protein BFP76_00530 [Amylibacter kogurei]|uniref:Uncharacterized protein n=1 Tax=Paramylibacter kogurei TaxID=1889778 RepID=A0A2G5KAI9_9RHOB|nr:hypothetical protein [Amylibacter kogurei]PIB25654.1 hypothetical protein BFP76_00530 [Amylibacter kogurei]
MRIIKDTIPDSIVKRYHKSEEKAFGSLENFVHHVISSDFDSFEPPEQPKVQFNPRIVQSSGK